jgi:hypothetical protein
LWAVFMFRQWQNTFQHRSVLENQTKSLAQL